MVISFKKKLNLKKKLLNDTIIYTFNYSMYFNPDVISIIMSYCDDIDVVKYSHISKIFRDAIGEKFINDQKRIFFEQQKLMEDFEKLTNIEIDIYANIKKCVVYEEMGPFRKKMNNLFFKFKQKFNKQKLNIEDADLKKYLQMGRDIHKDQRILLSKLSHNNLKIINTNYGNKLLHVFFETIVHNDIDLLKKIYYVNPHFLDEKNSLQFITACKTSSIEIVKWIYENTKLDDQLILKGFMMACLHRKTEIINWMKGLNIIYDKELLNICSSDDFDMNTYAYLRRKYFDNYNFDF